MRNALFLCAITFIFYGCPAKKIAYKNYESENLKIEQIRGDVFVHISYLKTEDFGKVACNGMVYFNEDEAIVFDTPTDNEASLELINWIETKHKKKIKAVIGTHFHGDCLGGLEAFHNNGTKSHASKATIALARKDKQEILPEHSFEDRLELKIGGRDVFTVFFGQGHTADNVVGYIPSERALFGGCLVKSLKAGKGNLEDANVAEWSETIEKIKSEIPDLEIVIPGHGSHGGTALLDYTSQMFEAN